MPVRVWCAKQGCGMGACAVADNYFQDREFVLSTKKYLPERCRECVDETEKDTKILVEKGVRCQ